MKVNEESLVGGLCKTHKRCGSLNKEKEERRDAMYKIQSIYLCTKMQDVSKKFQSKTHINKGSEKGTWTNLEDYRGW